MGFTDDTVVTETVDKDETTSIPTVGKTTTVDYIPSSVQETSTITTLPGQTTEETIEENITEDVSLPEKITESFVNVAEESTGGTQETTSQFSEANTEEGAEVATMEPSGVTEETTTNLSSDVKTENERDITKPITIETTSVAFIVETTPELLEEAEELSTETQDEARTKPDQSVPEQTTAVSLQESTDNTTAEDQTFVSTIGGKDREKETTEITSTKKVDEVTTEFKDELTTNPSYEETNTTDNTLEVKKADNSEVVTNSSEDDVTSST